ncbi:type II secretion system protein [Phycisphaerales bacterium AB-hyl4]|uniref:Type II secretion system protein n=1 Tax=Natronomicrosphaera hydrolytica TaxID=3242702 RepID=A0ABV4U7Y6_9BACT
MNNKRAFTLIELIVVISIIALMIALLLPVLNNARANARLVECSAMLRSLGMSSEIYLNDYNFTYPVAYFRGTWPSSDNLVTRQWPFFLSHAMGKIQDSHSEWTSLPDFWCPGEPAGQSPDMRPYSYGQNWYAGYHQSDSNYQYVREPDVVQPSQTIHRTDGAHTGTQAGWTLVLRQNQIHPARHIEFDRHMGGGMANFAYMDMHVVTRRQYEEDWSDVSTVSGGRTAEPGAGSGRVSDMSGQVLLHIGSLHIVV